MGYVMGQEGLHMTKGAPADGEYPASPSEIEMEMPSGEHMSMGAVTVSTIAPTDDSDNYHFMPHVVWIEPGQTVFWEHYHEPGFSERRTHTVTSFGGSGLFPRLIPEGASHFDSGYRAGTHGSGDPDIDERFNRKMVQLVGQEGGFAVKFQQKGVYLYYCQNHHMFNMAGAVVVGEIWGENGEKGEPREGWAPAMTADPHHLEEADPMHGASMAHQVEELRGFVHAGRAGGMH
jgi:plastocyanin